MPNGVAILRPALSKEAAGGLSDQVASFDMLTRIADWQEYPSGRECHSPRD